MRRQVILLSALLGACTPANEAPENEPAPAEPDVFLGRVASGSDGWSVSEVRNATNRPGYDNQPHITPDGLYLLYTSQREGQTDIYRMEVASGEHEQLTRTTESEYSATTMPDGGGFSVIRVEADSTQRLWAFDFDGNARGLVFEDIAPVGYHAWANPNAVAMFVLPVDSQGITLHLGDPTTGAHSIITNQIGRSLNPIPGRNTISFVHKGTTPWTVQELDPATGETRVLTETLEGSEDHAWLPDGTLVMGSGSNLQFWNAADGWSDPVDLSGQGVMNISRLAVRPDGTWIAIVADGTH